MIDCAIDDRGMIIEAVLDGILPPDFITDDELFDLENELFEAVCDKYTPFAIWETEQ